jgi:hypothetical protein
VRVGDTVRRPAGPWSESVDRFLVHLNAVGFAGAPRSLGFDDHGRHVVEYVEGAISDTLQVDDVRAAMHRIGSLLRDFHDASAEYVVPRDAQWNVVIPPDSQDLIVHHDAAPWNLVLGTNRWVLIDWDGAGPGSRGWDLAYACHGFVPLSVSTPIGTAAGLVADLAAGYRLDDAGRRGLADTLERRTLSMYELLKEGHRTGRQPWARLWDEGHGQVWLSDARFIEANSDRLRAALLDAT